MLMKRQAAQGGTLAPVAPVAALRGALISFSRVPETRQLTPSCSAPARVNRAVLALAMLQPGYS